MNPITTINRRDVLTLLYDSFSSDSTILTSPNKQMLPQKRTIEQIESVSDDEQPIVENPLDGAVEIQPVRFLGRRLLFLCVSTGSSRLCHHLTLCLNLIFSGTTVLCCFGVGSRQHLGLYAPTFHV